LQFFSITTSEAFLRLGRSSGMQQQNRKESHLS